MLKFFKLSILYLVFNLAKFYIMDRHNLWIYNDKVKRHFFLKNEIKRTILRSIIRNKTVSNFKRYKAFFNISNLPLSSSISTISYRCSISGRIWSVNRKTRLSRFNFRTKALSSSLPGYRRASW